jgi:hypothetical protein
MDPGLPRQRLDQLPGPEHCKQVAGCVNALAFEQRKKQYRRESFAFLQGGTDRGQADPLLREEAATIAGGDPPKSINYKDIHDQIKMHPQEIQLLSDYSF